MTNTTSNHVNRLLSYSMHTRAAKMTLLACIHREIEPQVTALNRYHDTMDAIASATSGLMGREKGTARYAFGSQAGDK